MVRKPLISSAPWLVPKDLTANWRGLQAGGKGKQRQVVRVAESQLAHLPRPADDAESSVEAAASFPHSPGWFQPSSSCAAKVPERAGVFGLVQVPAWPPPGPGTHQHGPGLLSLSSSTPKQKIYESSNSRHLCCLDARPDRLQQV